MRNPPRQARSPDARAGSPPGWCLGARNRRGVRALRAALSVLVGAVGAGCGTSTSLPGDDTDGTDGDLAADCGEVSYLLPTGGVGAPCTTGSDCDQPTVPFISGAHCRPSFTTPAGEFALPGGYCTSGAAYPVPSTCAPGDGCMGSVYDRDGVPDPGVRVVSFDGSDTGFCIRLCHSASDCRSGYSCMSLPPFVGYLGCLPSDLVF